MHGMNKRKGKETGFYEKETLEVRRLTKIAKEKGRRTNVRPRIETMRKGGRRRRRNIIPAQR
jgi:hypothetical protein